jgi:predicted nucleotidyltransferase
VLDLIEQNRGAIEELCRRFHVKRLDIFGSAVTGKFDPARSDLDFLVEFEELEPIERSRSYLGLLFGLEDLFGRHIDLVEPTAIRNPFFASDVEEHRRELYAA